MRFGFTCGHMLLQCMFSSVRTFGVLASIKFEMVSESKVLSLSPGFRSLLKKVLVAPFESTYRPQSHM